MEAQLSSGPGCCPHPRALDTPSDHIGACRSLLVAGSRAWECHQWHQVLCDIRQNRDKDVTPGSELGDCPTPPGSTQGHRGRG